MKFKLRKTNAVASLLCAIASSKSSDMSIQYGLVAENRKVKSDHGRGIRKRVARFR